MKTRNTAALKCSGLTASLTACMSLGVATPLLAAQPHETAIEHVPAQDATVASNPNAARQCMTDLRTFDGLLRKDGYWLHGAGFGYGYPMYGFGYPYGGYVPIAGRLEASGYGRARPGYDVRTLIAAANILALRGQQRECETLLTGSVEDVLLSPKSGQIEYLVIGRGGVFGLDEKYVPVPWNAFKMAKGALLLVLDASKANMDLAPQIKEKVFAADVNFGRDNEKADDYWKTQVSR
jgi:PRC-barrel domain